MKYYMMRDRRDEILRYMRTIFEPPRVVAKVIYDWFDRTNNEFSFPGKLRWFDVVTIQNDIIIVYKLNDVERVKMRFTMTPATLKWYFVGYQMDYADATPGPTFDPNDAWDRAFKGM